MRAAVLGSPIAHSLSPALHRAAYQWLGLDWTYEAVECTQADLPAFLAGLDESWAGLSLTMPLKAAVLPLLAEVSEVAQLVGAANTVVRSAGGWRGSNTDVPGIAAALAERGVAGSAIDRATVLGAGATARSAVAGLAELGVGAVDVYGRDPVARAAVARLAETLGLLVVEHDWSDAAQGLANPLVVSTVTAGAADHLAGQLPTSPGTLFDVLYEPWPTPVARAWSSSSGVVVSGLDLLVQQAARQVQAMTRTDASAEQLVAVLRPAGIAALEAR